jgi:hypothetical protein
MKAMISCKDADFCRKILAFRSFQMFQQTSVKSELVPLMCVSGVCLIMSCQISQEDAAVPQTVGSKEEQCGQTATVAQSRLENRHSKKR